MIDFDLAARTFDMEIIKFYQDDYNKKKKGE